MRTTILRLQQAVSQKTPRERSILLALAVTVAGIVWFQGLLQPIRAWAAHARESHDQALADHRDMRPILAGIRQSALPPRDSLAGSNLLELSMGTASTVGLTIAGHRTESDGQLVLVMSGVPASSLFSWLKAMRDDNGLVPERVMITRSDAGLDAELWFAPISG